MLRSNNVRVIGFNFQGPTSRCFVWRQSTGGLDLSAWAPADIEGNARPRFWAYDIGAYEFTNDNGSFRVLKWSEQQ